MPRRGHGITRERMLPRGTRLHFSEKPLVGWLWVCHSQQPPFLGRTRALSSARSTLTAALKFNTYILDFRTTPGCPVSTHRRQAVKENGRNGIYVHPSTCTFAQTPTPWSDSLPTANPTSLGLETSQSLHCWLPPRHLRPASWLPSAFLTPAGALISSRNPKSGYLARLAHANAIGDLEAA
jgi:hypothetical protein